MQATSAQPLLSAIGRDQDRRTFKHYFACYAREEYPALGMSKELLTLNLSLIARVDALPPSALPGEARHAFKRPSPPSRLSGTSHLRRMQTPRAHRAETCPTPTS